MTRSSTSIPHEAGARAASIALNADRRRVLHAAGALPVLAFAACTPARSTSARPTVVVVGGGYGGATAARYAALWGGDAVDVTLIERDAAFVSCPLSNLVLGGSRSIADLTLEYGALARRGIRVIRDSAVAVDATRRRVRLARGPELAYDRLILSPGIDFFFDRVEDESHLAGLLDQKQGVAADVGGDVAGQDLAAFQAVHAQAGGATGH